MRRVTLKWQAPDSVLWSACVRAYTCMHERARGGRESFLFTLAILILLINTDLFPKWNMQVLAEWSSTRSRRLINIKCAVSAFLQCFMMEPLLRGETAASFTCSYSILGAQEKQENSPLYAIYLLMPETVCVRVWVCVLAHTGSFFTIGRNVHLLPIHY